MVADLSAPLAGSMGRSRGSRRLCLPGIEGSNIPNVSLGIAAGECLTAMVLLCQIDHHLGACHLGAGVDGIYVGYDKIRSLGLCSADLIRLLQQLRHWRPTDDRADHDHAVAESQLGMHHHTVSTGINGLLLKPECPAQPIDHLDRISIAEPRDYA